MADAYTNFAKSTLAGGLAPATVALTVQVGDGALFPAAGAGATFRCVLQNAANQREVILVTARAGDAFTTIVRAQEGTTALTWNAGDKVGHRLTAAGLNNLLFAGNLQANTPTWCGVAGGTANALTLTPTPAIAAYAAGMKFIFKTGAAANTTPVTIAISGLATLAAQNSGAALLAGDMPANTWWELLCDGVGGAQLKKFELGIPRAIGTAKGDIIAYTAAGAPINVAAGADGTLLFADSTQTPGVKWGTLGNSGVRQTVLTSVLDANGYCALLAAGAALNFNVDASPTPAVLSFANGYNVNGPVDTYAGLVADQANQGALFALNTSFIHATFLTASTVTWGQCLVPPQYGYKFDQTKQALLNFEGLNGAVTTTDDFGGTWTLVNGAQISTAQFKFGTSAALLDGVNDRIDSNSFTSLGDGSWEISYWMRFPALPGVGVTYELNGFGTTTGFGARLQFANAAGITKLGIFLSSDAATHNIANNVLGAATVWAANTWYKIRIIFDALAGSYKVFLSNNGALETTDITVASALRINAGTLMRIGASLDTGGAPTNAFVDAYRFLPCATNTSAEVPSAAAPAIGDYPVHFFSIPEMKMYEATAASAVAGTNPTLTQRNRLFVAEADTSGVAVTAVRNYALRGEYLGPFSTLTATTVNNFNHNLGVISYTTSSEITCLTANSSYIPGDEAQPLPLQRADGGTDIGFGFTYRRKNSVGHGLLAQLWGLDTSAIIQALSLPLWKYRVRIKRTW